MYVYMYAYAHIHTCIYAHILTHVDAYTFLSNISFKYCFLVISFIIQWQKPLALLGSWAGRLSSKRCGPDVLASSASQELARAKVVPFGVCFWEQNRIAKPPREKGFLQTAVFKGFRVRFQVKRFVYFLKRDKGSGNKLQIIWDMTKK